MKTETMALLTILSFLGASFFMGCLYGSVKEDTILINKLCSKQQYDFCEIKQIQYKFKEK